MITVMKWRNLNEDKCPYCGSPLLIRDDDESEIVCSRCRFMIGQQRFNDIKKNRSNSEQGIIKIKWQNLHDNKCPLCSSDLYHESMRSLFKCNSVGCTFVIKEIKKREILEDQSHPANRFSNRVIDI